MMDRRTFNAAALLAGLAPARAVGAVDGARLARSSPKSGGVLRGCASYEPGSLDIHRIQSGNMLWQARWLFDGLVCLDAGQPAPWLARAWTISDGGRTYVFHLLDGVSFSDGSPFDAAAVKANFERIRSLGIRSQISNAYLGPYREAVVRGPLTIEVRLDAPFPGFLFFLAQVWMGFISARQIRDAPDSIEHGAVGTGPFVLGDYQPRKQARFVRREDYRWGPPSLGHRGPALLDAIVLEAVPSDADRTEGLLRGAYHIDFEASARTARSLAASPSIVLTNHIRPGGPMRGLSFNTARFPFDDVTVRRAAALAIDRVAITRSLSDGFYCAKSDYLGANTPGYTGEWRATLDFDRAKAARLFDAAGWSRRDIDGVRVRDGVRLRADLATTGTERTPPASVEAMCRDLREIGLDLQPRKLSNTALETAVRNGDYDAVAGGWWSVATPDVLYLLYHSSQILRQNSFGQDTARISDSELDVTLQYAWAAPTPRASRILYEKVQRRLVELVPNVSLHESHYLLAHHRDLRGIQYDGTHQTPVLTTAWLKQRA
jgi:peptide/nickel transport system substrate-binding protein